VIDKFEAERLATVKWHNCYACSYWGHDPRSHDEAET